MPGRAEAEAAWDALGVAHLPVAPLLCAADGTCDAHVPGTNALAAIDYAHLTTAASLRQSRAELEETKPVWVDACGGGRRPRSNTVEAKLNDTRPRPPRRYLAPFLSCFLDGLVGAPTAAAAAEACPTSLTDIIA